MGKGVTRMGSSCAFSQRKPSAEEVQEELSSLEVSLAAESRGDPLDSAGLGNSGPLVDEGDHEVGPGVLALDDGVVVSCPRHFDEPQVGLGPADSVPALGQATALDVVIGHAAVVHAVDSVVVKDADSEVVATLPGAIHPNGYLGRLGMMQFEAGANQTINQEMVDEQLPSGTDVEGLLWV